jgi:hypothetical protein
LPDLKSQNRTFFDSVYLEPGSEVELKAGIPVSLGTTIVTVSLSETDDGQMTSFSETVKLSRADIEKASQMTERRNETEEKKLQLLRKASEQLVSGIPIYDALENARFVSHISKMAESLVPDEE